MADRVVNPIDQIYNDQHEIIKFLNDNKEISFASTLDDHFKKLFVLSSASYFEVVITQIIVDFIERKSEGIAIVKFLENKALKRQYHTLFSWEKKNCNSFFGLFGDEFKNKIVTVIQSNAEINQGMINFLEIGMLRNHLIHKNIATQFVNDTASELYKKYESAVGFVSFLEKYFEEFYD